MAAKQMETHHTSVTTVVNAAPDQSSQSQCVHMLQSITPMATGLNEEIAASTYAVSVERQQSRTVRSVLVGSKCPCYQPPKPVYGCLMEVTNLQQDARAQARRSPQPCSDLGGMQSVSAVQEDRCMFAADSRRSYGSYQVITA